VKTAISLPDDLFALATERAAELGVSRSQLFATALRRFLDDLDASSLVARIDAAAEVANADESARQAVDAGRRVLGRGAGPW
jgi:metal-responsive CopG/Arc/MetJ family transcriptional regulator